MKKILLLIISIIAFASYSYGQGISGTAHDFSQETWNTTGEICATCHTPHGASSIDGPLWNHKMTASSFQLYTSTSLDATITQPDGNSKLCLSCHDGITALEDFGGATGGSNYVTTGEIGTDLKNHHPVSFDYTTSLASTDGGLNDPSTASSGLSGTIAEDLLEGGVKMQCSSCHDVHGNGNTKLLVVLNTTSALCLLCHDK